MRAMVFESIPRDNRAGGTDPGYHGTMSMSGKWLPWWFLLVTCVSSAGADEAAQRALLDAAAGNDVARLSTLLRDDLDLEYRDARGRTALLLATHANAVAAARLLVAAGADVNAMDAISDSPYLYAGAEGRLEILRLTLEHGADLSSVNRYGGTALIPAAHHGHIEVVRELLQTEIDIDHINRLGWTALLEAVILGDGGPTYVEIVRLLLDAGADREIADGDGITPLQHARARGYDAMVRLLE